MAPPPDAAVDADAEAIVTPRSAGELFLAFAGFSVQAFGGALAFMERTVVRDKRWLSARDFLGLYAICQVLPGPTGISFCVLLGDRFFGLRGAIACVGGFLLLPAVIVIGVTSLFQHFQSVPEVQGALHGMGAAAVGVVLNTVLRMTRSLRGYGAGIVVAALSFIAVGLLHLSVASVVLTVGVLSVVWAWRALGR
jgi:chromate transporter